MRTLYKKNNTGSVAIFFGIVFLVLAAGSYFVYKVFSTEDVKPPVAVATSTQKGNKTSTITKTVTPTTTAVKKTTSTVTKTKTVAPLPLPKISNISLTNKTASTAFVTWKTNVPTTGQIFYSEDQSSSSESFSSSTVLEKDLTVEHSATLSDLVSGKKYYYKIISTDALGNKISSAELSFTGILLTISVPKTSNVSDTKATVSWNTNLETEGKIIYDIQSSPSGLYTLSNTIEESFGISHSREISNLVHNTKYYYRIVTSDKSGNKNTSPEYSFISSYIHDVVANDSYSSGMFISWITSIATKSEIKYGTQTSNYPFTALDGSLINNHSLLLTNLDSNTIYYYRIISTDSAGKKTTSVEYNFKTRI